MKILKAKILLASLLFVSFLSANATGKNFIDINTYGDVRGFGTITPSIKLDLPYKLTYFSFANLNLYADSDTFTYYTEQDLYLQIKNTPFYLAQQFVSLSGDDNDMLRYGPRVIVSDLPKLKKVFDKIGLYYEMSSFPLQIDHSDGFDMGFEHFYYMKIFPKLFKDRVYCSGFVDHNLEFGELSNNHSIAVTENQIGVRVVDNFYLVAELRYNGYLPTEQVGVGIGFEYLNRF